MAKEVFAENRIFAYNRARKTAFGIAVIISAVIAASFLISYFLVLKNSEIAFFVYFSRITSHVVSNIISSTYLGMFYTALVGGLFFIFMPLEVLFLKSLNSGNSFILILILYLLGVSISYSVDYFIGLKLSKLSRKLIPPKKFYSIKGKINRYGGWAIFFFNVLPLPSQILAAILGVFRYNTARFYIFLLLGQLVKCIAIGLGVYYIL
ncbi:VTT domain-containing protein [Candidatus Woesearchaeota archaeon]|nr:VTT domain-containing protein [Candidatus Woesearchaeota archaeon]